MTDNRWIRLGGVAGISYVFLAVCAAALPGAPPPADGKATTYQNYFIDHHQALVTQGWMYGLAASLMLIFAVSVRRVLRKSEDGGYFSELFLVGIAAVAGLLLVGMAMQIAVAQRAGELPAEVAFTVGVHFVGVLFGLEGFPIAAAAFAYAYCVFAYHVLPRWTAYFAVLAFTASLVATAGVFFRTGPFCLEGGFAAWAPAVSLALWYLATSVALLRTRDWADSTPRAARD
jgi:hypothetical protein